MAAGVRRDVGVQRLCIVTHIRKGAKHDTMRVLGDNSIDRSKQSVDDIRHHTPASNCCFISSASCRASNGSKKRAWV